MYKRLSGPGVVDSRHMAIASCIWVGNVATDDLILRDIEGNNEVVRSAAPGADVNIFPSGWESKGLEIVQMGGGVLEIAYSPVGGS